MAAHALTHASSIGAADRQSMPLLSLGETSSDGLAKCAQKSVLHHLHKCEEDAHTVYAQEGLMPLSSYLVGGVNDDRRLTLSEKSGCCADDCRFPGAGLAEHKHRSIRPEQAVHNHVGVTAGHGAVQPDGEAGDSAVARVKRTDAVQRAVHPRALVRAELANLRRDGLDVRCSGHALLGIG
eukprot:2818083-Pleurochrysis_carterae.AAC.4